MAFYSSCPELDQLQNTSTSSVVVVKPVRLELYTNANNNNQESNPYD